MSRSEKIAPVMMRAVLVNDSKDAGKLTNRVTINAYKKSIDRFVLWAQKNGIKRTGDIERASLTPRSLIQKYADEMLKDGVKPTTLHTYLAPVCKGLNVPMGEIKIPGRKAKDITKNTVRAPGERGLRELSKPENQRIVRLAQLVGVRPEALVTLTEDSLVKDSRTGLLLVRVVDKGGKISNQIVFPEEEQELRRLLTTDAAGNPLLPGQKPFSSADIKCMPLTRFRCLRAQAIEARFEALFNGYKRLNPSTPPKERAAAQAKAEAAKQRWIGVIVNMYREAHPNSSRYQIDRFERELRNPEPYFLRKGNLKRAKELGRPTAYDRVALKITSVFALSHWEDDSTVRNYLTK